MDDRHLPWPLRWCGPVATIAVAQLLGTSLWFSANSAAADLMIAWQVSAADIGWLTSSVQVGFILGTLFIALSGLADRYRASRIFVCSAVAGALFNAGFAWLSEGLTSAMVFRFLVGVSLAGIYPVGMKLIVSWAPERTGQALAQLVAMLTLGTALPHALRQVGADLPWQTIILASSGLALLGALLIHWLGDGPHLPDARQRRAPSPSAVGRRVTVLDAFRVNRFRAAALGYFGHMWELYAFWTVVPLLVSHTVLASKFAVLGVSGMSFGIIGVGALGCVMGGWLSRRFGSAKVALGALGASCACAVVFAMFWQDLPAIALGLLLLVWGATVVADSPQFSALSAQACPRELVGAALAIQNSIGFAITVVSIAATTMLFERIGLGAAWLLVPGPIVGLLGFAWASRRSINEGVSTEGTP
ncbi:MFS transporter [Halomonas urumqiensis]|uniref:MFS transporter n=1 Tax=Halomonas urumqiensis TaxID=1684789 RepID=A0A2N7UMW2_9GAMM|nr:MFS transporter [Halomonas urumqiensis]PTB02449.1 MFS transporter [Halomonas urumqiensis]